VWVYRVFWAKIETKPQKKIHTRLKQSFFLFIYLFIIIILLLLLFRQSKKPKRKLIYFVYLFFIFLYLFLKKTNYYYLFSRTKLGVDTSLCYIFLYSITFINPLLFHYFWCNILLTLTPLLFHYFSFNILFTLTPLLFNYFNFNILFTLTPLLFNYFRFNIFLTLTPSFSTTSAAPCSSASFTQLTTSSASEGPTSPIPTPYIMLIISGFVIS